MRSDVVLREQPRRLIITVNEDRFLLSHRLPVALAALEAGWEVAICALDTGLSSKIKSHGLEFIPLPINPTGTNPLEELRTLRFLETLYRSRRDSVVHHVGMKNILWGGIAARRAGVRGVLNAVSGVGSLFSQYSRVPATRLLSPLLRWGMHRPGVAVLFQNNDDFMRLSSRRITDGTRVEFLKGSGIDVEEFAYAPEPAEGPAIVLFTGRMLRQKGVEDLAHAARLLQPRWEGRAEFWLCGPLSSNSGALSASDLEQLCDGKYIRWLGERDDVKDLLGKCAVMAFPSYYGEGVPKSLLEASAVGRPIVTTTSTGCRDTVEEGVNGFKVAPRSPELLADRIGRLLEDRDLRCRMGKESRRIAERDYTIGHVVERHLEIYDYLYSASR